MDPAQLYTEISYKAVRSSGAGGQHVNKVSTKVELVFDVANSQLLSENQKGILLEKLKTRITKNGLLILRCDATRSQAKNREIALERFISLVKEALKPVKKRKRTKPTKASVDRRLNEKRKQSEKKESRKNKPEE
ncbi:MAG: alternative ribosome rescue aminoacyl-tRNA hydrolase ArfB [bacterium]